MQHNILKYNKKFSLRFAIYRGVNLETERGNHRVCVDRDQAWPDLFGYVEGFYNPRRLHSVPGYISPAQAECNAA